ncbi:MAG TPA: ABC transporter permease [Candidatus Syntrophoarchaeum butanivorans]|uniref:ABC transporter permease n=1 Tax=Candidatus Syntropharchaeum butanivorans TaxID=1839936 RepID=A0A7C0X2Y9_9EURY|nr:MAG: ABC transporter permease [Candidatus Syntrophoarchaeum sp. WYZ-LMO15]HDM36584.1 ABC transporter permease [Candidatus Syntrophoarchaeum butanivorans]
MRRKTLNIIGLLLFFLLWQLIPMVGLVNPDYLPPFSDAIMKIPTEIGKGTLQAALLESLLHYAIGFGGALLLAIPLGVAMGRFRVIESLLYPVEEMVRPIPPIAWIPVAIIWFGYTPWAAGFIIFIGAFFPTLINTYDGVRGVSRTDIEAAITLGVRDELTMIRKIVLPASLPNIFTGVRVSNAAAWMCLVAGEMFGAGGGIGLELTLSRNYMDMARIFAYMLILGVIGLSSDIGFRRYESKVLRWRKGVVA